MTLPLGWDSLRDRMEGLLPSGSLRARFAKGAFWAIAGVATSQVIALAASIVVARIFDSRPRYGELGMIRNTLAVFGTFAGLGMGLTATKHVAELRRTDPARAGRILSITLAFSAAAAALMALVILAGAPWIAAGILNAPNLTAVLRLGCALLFFETMNGAQNGALAGFEAFRAIAGLALFRGLVTFPLLVGGAWFGRLEGAVAGLTLAAAAGWLANRIMLGRLRRRYGIPASRLVATEVRREIDVLWNFALPTSLSGVLYISAPWAAAAILVHIMGQTAGYDALGLFNAANQWQYPITLLPAQLGMVLLPVLASLSGAQAAARRQRAAEAAHLVILIVVLPLAAILASLARPVMGLYGDKFRGGEWVFWAALFVAGAKSFGTVPGTIIQARGAMWASFSLNLGWAAALLTVVWAWANRGASRFADAFSLTVAASAVAGLLYCVSVRLCSWRLVWRICCALALLGAFTYGMYFAESIGWRVLLVFASCAIGGIAGRSAWHQIKEERASPIA